MIVSGFWTFTTMNLTAEYKFTPTVCFDEFFNASVESVALCAEIAAGV